jgi:hypothetical protein
VPSFQESRLEWRGGAHPKSVRLLRDGAELLHTYENGVLTIDLPLEARTPLVDVVKVAL